MEFQFHFIIVTVFHRIRFAAFEADIPDILIGIELAVLHQGFRVDKRKTV